MSFFVTFPHLFYWLSIFLVLLFWDDFNEFHCSSLWLQSYLSFGCDTIQRVTYRLSFRHSSFWFLFTLTTDGFYKCMEFSFTFTCRLDVPVALKHIFFFSSIYFYPDSLFLVICLHNIWLTSYPFIFFIFLFLPLLHFSMSLKHYQLVFSHRPRLPWYILGIGSSRGGASFDDYSIHFSLFVIWVITLLHVRRSHCLFTSIVYRSSIDIFCLQDY